jgi:hypothetical protein
MDGGTTMRNAKHIGRVGALAVALGVGLAVATTPGVASAGPADSNTCSSSDSSSPASTALIMGTSGVPTPDDFYVESVKNQFIAPTHPGQDIEYCAVTTPEGLWPLGVGRLLSLLPGFPGSPEIFGPGGPAWDVPWWNLTGLFDLTLNQSIQAGVTDLEDAMVKHPNESLIIFGYSQSAVIANLEKRKLAEQYPEGTDAPDIDFVLFGDPNLPNGGLFARFPGLYIPILDWYFNGPAPTDTQFDMVEITRQYDLMADFPLYPLNLVADLNAVLGFFYVHLYPFDVSLPTPDPTESPAYQGKYGDTSYYFFETQDLPLFGPLRTLGVPEPLIDVFEPFFRVLVELGYDRSIKPWVPTPARLIPTLDPATVATDLVNAIGEGINNAGALIGSPPPLSIPAAPATADQDAAVEQVRSAAGTPFISVSRDVDDGVSQVLSAVGSQPPEPIAVSHDNLKTSQPTVGREPAATRDQIDETIGAVKSVIGNGRTIVRSAGGDNGSNPATTSPARKTPVRDAVNKASSDIKKVVTQVSDTIKTAPTGGNDDDDNKGDGGEGGAQ